MARYTCSVRDVDYELDLTGATFNLSDSAGLSKSGRVHRERDKLILVAEDMRWEAKFNGECVEVYDVETFMPR